MGEEYCEPCAIAATGGILIEKHCKGNQEECQKLLEEFSKGDMTLMDLKNKLNIPDEVLDIFISEGVPINITYKQAVEEYNKEQKKHLT